MLCSPMPGFTDHKLHISRQSLSDGQLNTKCGLVRRVRLAVREMEGSVRALQGREDRDSTRILGPSRLRVEAGARLSLECLVTHKHRQHPAFITWLVSVVSIVRIVTFHQVNASNHFG